MFGKITRVFTTVGIFAGGLSSTSVYAVEATRLSLDGLKNLTPRRPTAWEEFQRDPSAIMIAVLVVVVIVIGIALLRKNNSPANSGDQR